ncbi:uncharacterized protein LOC108910455 [Anoplophora glabripennis]|uniref:uncharacterized protein LOC108910455 n=1 Tax=Anoplophora glabripennis TaxID=217634 RepID=UPI000874277C|nr:uncharacterized protein LOC108910455 [Anoplophora glabripennis]
MICRVFVCLLVYRLIGAKAQQCVPDPIFNIYLEDTTLSWQNISNCEGISYVTIIHSRNAGEIEYVYQGEDTTIDVSFLPYCRSYIFTVCAYSSVENLAGPFTQIGAYVPLPEGSSIGITNISGSQIGNNILIEWQVLREYLHCLDHYRILLWDEDSSEPKEITTRMNGYYITNAPFCMTYRVDMSVVYGGTENPVSTFNYTVPSATNNLSLLSVTQSATTINITWGLEIYSVNRCTVTSLTIVGTVINLTIPIQDSPERPPISVNLSGLKANSMYYFNVTVENEAGTSRPFQLAVQTLPIGYELDFDIGDSFDGYQYVQVSYSNG